MPPFESKEETKERHREVETGSETYVKIMQLRADTILL
jgi:hypothetical protein